MCFHKSGNKQVRKCLLIQMPVNKTGAMGKKKQNNSCEEQHREKGKSIGSLTGGSSLVRLFSVG